MCEVDAICFVSSSFIFRTGGRRCADVDGVVNWINDVFDFSTG